MELKTSATVTGSTSSYLGVAIIMVKRLLKLERRFYIALIYSDHEGLDMKVTQDCMETLPHECFSND